MTKEKILITVKTYPTLSKTHGETVCTAGVRPDGSWIRIYPVPFRRLDQAEQYSKFDWIETALVKSRSDHRPESYNPVDLKKMKPMGHMGTSSGWKERRDLLLKKATVYDRLEPLLEGAKKNSVSLAVFKPTKIIDFIWEDAEEKDWDEAKVGAMRQNAAQSQLFSEENWRNTFRLIPKLPHTFSYKFVDADGRKSTLQVLDWEIGQLFWNCMKLSSKKEQTALMKVRKKYFDEFTKCDLHFFLGTMKEFHGRAPNPWVIIGVFPIPHEKQLALL